MGRRGRVCFAGRMGVRGGDVSEAQPNEVPANRLVGEEERVLKVVRPAMFRAKPLLYLLHVLGIVGSIVGAIWVGFFTDYPWVAIVCGVVGLAALGSLGYWWMVTWSVALRITTERTIEDRGFFSRRTSEVLHENIRNVQISQSFWNRIWGVGRLEIASAGHEGFEITFDDVPKPYEVRALIDEYREFGEGD